MMQRRKASSKDSDINGQVNNNNNASIQVPMGDFSTTQQTRRRRKKAQSTFRSCLIRLRILGGDRRKKLDGINHPGQQRRRGGGGLGGFCCCVAIFIFFTGIGLILYEALEWLEGRNSNLIIRATTNIPMEIYSNLEFLRPIEYGKNDLPIVLYSLTKKRRNAAHHDDDNHRREFEYPGELHHKEKREAEYVDFGNIDLRLLATEDQKREIYIMPEELQGEARSLDAERDDDMEQYWAFDDDKERNPYNLYDTYLPSMMDGACRRLPWHRYNLPSCNSMHELDLVTNTPRFVGDGAYREVFVTNQPYMGETEEMIFKELRWDLEMGVDDYEYVRMDAFVTERFTSHEQISDIYGYCGLSMVTEFFPYGDIEKDVVGFQHHRKHFNPLKDPVLRPLNNFTGAEKLQLSLNMVEPVAALHNYPGGVIVHDDIQLCQYLWTDENGINVKLNDFNRAEIMLWDEKSERYCKYKNGRGHGDWRSPEEYKDLPLDEKIDIWSLGNNMYSVLTGVYPFFNVEGDKKIQKLIKDGETAAIDPRYLDNFAESKLVEVIQRCFEYNPDLRADINEIWNMLKDAITENEKHEKEEAKKKALAEAQEKEEAERQQKEKAEKEAREKAEAIEAQRRAKEAEEKEKAEKEAREKAETIEAQQRAKEEKRQEEEAAQKRAQAEEQRKREEAQEQAAAEEKQEQAQKLDKEEQRKGEETHDHEAGGQQQHAEKDSHKPAEPEVVEAQRRAKEDQRLAEEAAHKKVEAEQERRNEEAKEEAKGL